MTWAYAQRGASLGRARKGLVLDGVPVCGGMVTVGVSRWSVDERHDCARRFEQLRVLASGAQEGRVSLLAVHWNPLIHRPSSVGSPRRRTLRRSAQSWPHRPTAGSAPARRHQVGNSRRPLSSPTLLGEKRPTCRRTHSFSAPPKTSQSHPGPYQQGTSDGSALACSTCFLSCSSN